MGIGELIGAGGVVTLILGAGKAIQWWVARRDAGKDPIPKQEAAVALADKGMAIMDGLVDDLRTELTREREERGELRRELASVRLELAGVRRDQMAAQQTLSMLQASLAAAARHIEAMYRWARDGATPPPPLIPDALRDLIDPSLHD